MNKANKDELLRSLKLFFINFVVFIIICLIVSKVFWSQKPIDFVYLIVVALLSSIGSSIGYSNRHKKYAAKILYKDVIDKELLIELQKIMKKMHWSMKKDRSEKMIFKSSVFLTYLTEYIVVTINKDYLELVGPQCYVEKVVKKLNV